MSFTQKVTYRLEVDQDILVHSIILKIYLDVRNNIIDDCAVNLRL